jgi:hypothetical protein
MHVRRFAVAIRILTMALCGVGVLFPFVVFAVIVVMGRLAVMMRGRVMGRGGGVMMLARRVLLLRCHGYLLPKTESATAAANSCAVVRPIAKSAADLSLAII